MEVNVAKTEVVVFRHPQFPAAGEAWQWQIDGQPVARAREFRYLGVILHETEGVSAAISSLATAATRATWAMISRFRVRKVRDIAVKLQMFRALVLPVLEYCGAIWGPDMLASSKHLSQVLDNPLQAVQTTFLRGLGLYPRQSCTRKCAWSQWPRDGYDLQSHCGKGCKQHPATVSWVLLLGSPLKERKPLQRGTHRGPEGFCL